MLWTASCFTPTVRGSWEVCLCSQTSKMKALICSLRRTSWNKWKRSTAGECRWGAHTELTTHRLLNVFLVGISSIDEILVFHIVILCVIMRMSWIKRPLRYYEAHTSLLYVFIMPHFKNNVTLKDLLTGFVTFMT